MALKNTLTHQAFELETSVLLDLESLLKENELEKIAVSLIDGTFKAYDLLKKDSLDKFLDFVIFKVKTGYPHMLSLAYPSMRMYDSIQEKKVIELLNYHLFPDIILRILKFFTRNIHNADTNLFLAYLIESDELIRSVYETFLLFRRDILNPDRDKRTLNVKRIQQYPPAKDNTHSSPLDAASRLKYILEFIALKQHVENIYTSDDIKLSVPRAKI